MIHPCLCCESPVNSFLDLGCMPLAGEFPATTDTSYEKQYPLDVGFCTNCCLVQLLDTVPRDKLFANGYAYYSSYSSTMSFHARMSALNLIHDRKLNESSLVIELGSNDGYMLRVFREHGIRVLGIDPAEGPAKCAISNGIPTRIEFFDADTARKLSQDGYMADVILANNVLAHVDDPASFLMAAGSILKQDGILVIEVPYVRDLIEKNEFDTIYHEHRCYFSVTAIINVLAMARLTLVHVDWVDIHGGSLRMYISCENAGVVDNSVTAIIEAERDAGMDRYEYYANYAIDVTKACSELCEFVGQLHGDGARIAAYGAAAKGSVLLNYAGIKSDIINFVADLNPHKQGRLMPGVHIPILSPDAILERMPDYLIILPWNLAGEIMAQQSEYRANGGQFIIPLPHPAVVP